MSADPSGAVVVWKGPSGLLLREIDPDGAPVSAAVPGPAGWGDVPRVLVGSDVVALVRMGEREIEVARLERASLQVASRRVEPRPPELDSVQEWALDGSEVLIVGSRGEDLAFFRTGGEGAARTVIARLPQRLPMDPMLTLGRWGETDAVWISTISGKEWLVRGAEVTPGDRDLLAFEQGPFVDLTVVESATGVLAYGLQQRPRHPLSRREDAELASTRPAEAFRIGCTHGFPAEAWTGKRFLFACAVGPRKALQAAVFAADCGPP